MALYLYHFDVLEEVDVIGLLAGSFIYYSIPYVCLTHACSSYFVLLELWSCLVRIRGRVRLSFGVESGWPASHIVWALALVMQIGFYLCLSFRVSPTNSETRSDLIYPTDPSRICLKRVIELLRLGCGAWNSWSSPSSDRGSLRPRVEEFI